MSRCDCARDDKAYYHGLSWLERKTRLEREKGISAFFRPVEIPIGKQKKSFSTHTLHVEGIDQAGIVYHISKYLAEHDINIADLSSQLKFSPESGTAIYTIEMQIEIPEGTSMEELEKPGTTKDIVKGKIGKNGADDENLPETRAIKVKPPGTARKSKNSKDEQATGNMNPLTKPETYEPE